MFWEIIDWCFGDQILQEKIQDVNVPEMATHMLIVRGETELKARKYTSLYKFNYIYFDELILPYNNTRDIVYDNICTGFNNIALREFFHLVFPNQKVSIEHVEIAYFFKDKTKTTKTEYLESKESYICKCSNNAHDCNFHKFLIEKLYSKYKNALFTENTSDFDYDCYDRCMD
jgi:hypothetical protein